MVGGLQFPGSGGLARRLYKTDWNNFGPRLGFAYPINDKLVARGAFGVMYGPSYKQAAGNGAATEDGFAQGGTGVMSDYQTTLTINDQNFCGGAQNTPLPRSVGYSSLYTLTRGSGPVPKICQ